MPSRSTRLVWIALALACALVVLASLALTAWLSLNPCHLCIFQRLLFMILALLAAASALAHRPAARGAVLAWRLLPAALFGTVAALGLSVAAYQSWLQAQPPGSTSCAGGPPGPIELLVEWLGQQAPFLFLATGFCEDAELTILGLSLANWALATFAGCLAAAAWATRRDEP
jgi:protein dithiol:quinone oxidoreductase